MPDAPIAQLLAASGVSDLSPSSGPDELAAAVENLREVVLRSKLTPLSRALLRGELVRVLKNVGQTSPAAIADAVIAASSDAQQEPQRALQVEPWPERVRGLELADELAETISRYVVLPSAAVDAVTLWILHTHAFAGAHISPRLAIQSPSKRCGKSTLLQLLGCLVRRPRPITALTSAVVFRLIEQEQPTLLVDEADTFLGQRDDVRGILNAGHDRSGAPVLRCEGENHELRQFRVWAPVAVAGIGKLPDTLQDRSIVISMKRKTSKERVSSLRRKQRKALLPLQRKCVRWGNDSAHHIEDHEPSTPEELSDRAADNWEPLLAIADRIGCSWATRARSAARVLSGSKRDADGDLRESLLADIRALFQQVETDRLWTSCLVEELCELEGQPWTESNRGRPLSAAQLARFLRPYGIRPRTIRKGEETRKGYYLADFEDAFQRYLQPSDTADTSGESEGKSAVHAPSRSGDVTTGGLDENAGDPSYVTYVPAREHEDRDEERAAIHEFEAGYSRAEADRLSWGPRSTARTNGGHSPAAQVIAQPLARRPGNDL